MEDLGRANTLLHSGIAHTCKNELNDSVSDKITVIIILIIIFIISILQYFQLPVSNVRHRLVGDSHFLESSGASKKHPIVQ